MGSDSRCMKDLLVRHFANSTLFQEVWAPKTEGFVNIDTRLRETESTKERQNQAWLQTMRDWVLMRHVDTLAMSSSYGHVSGFPASAMITSPSMQLYDLGKCEVLDLVSN